MKDFRRLVVWEKAHRLTLACYAATARFPREELYGLTSQVRRCSASIAASLARRLSCSNGRKASVAPGVANG